MYAPPVEAGMGVYVSDWARVRIGETAPNVCPRVGAGTGGYISDWARVHIRETG